MNVRRMIRRMLIAVLAWTRPRKKTVRTKQTFFTLEIHTPTWVMACIITVVFFCLLMYELGTEIHILGAIALLCVLCLVLSILFMRRFAPDILTSDDRVTLIGFLCVAFGLLIVLVHSHRFLHPLITPLPAAAMLATILIGPFSALLISLLTCITMTLCYGMDFPLFLIIFAGCLTAILPTLNVYHRRDITKAGMYVACVHLIVIASIEWFVNGSLDNILEFGGWGIVNGFLSAIITMGLLPYMESFFSITTNIRLLELGDFTQALLKRVMMEAPGTYQHSIVVGNLAEIAARTIGANALLVRVAAYYHDIGKIDKPEYFIENNPPNTDNKHDDISPHLSSLVILSHVKEGVLLAKKNKLDAAIVDIIEQHHGTSLIHYFYLKARTEDADIPEEQYRYAGPKPKTKEAAIVMLADCVEAATHADENWDHAHLVDNVARIINNKFVDGQLDDCDITLSDLHAIAQSFVKTLTEFYHSRIPYPMTDTDDHTYQKSTKKN